MNTSHQLTILSAIFLSACAPSASPTLGSKPAEDDIEAGRISKELEEYYSHQAAGEGNVVNEAASE